jgi:fatty acid synthase subunit alpha, fungi type
LSGGAHVVITTSSYSRTTVEYYQSIFQSFGSRGSALTVVPFNQASKQDAEALVDYIYANLGMDLDYILPFAGIPENGREIDGLDDKSELAHRMMLVNLLRIWVPSKTRKQVVILSPDQLKLFCHCLPTTVCSETMACTLSPRYLLKLSSNDGRPKVGEYLCLAGAIIG